MDDFKIKKHEFCRKFSDFFLYDYFHVKDTTILTENERNIYFNKLWKKIKDKDIASRKTVKKWFSQNTDSKPSRNTMIKLSFALGFDSKRLDKYLVSGISEVGTQVNDYREFTARYALDNHISFDEFEKMCDFFYQKYDKNVHLSQRANTEYLTNQYRDVQKMGRNDFLVWMCKNTKYFKGYSMITYKCFIGLLDQAYECIRNNTKEYMMRELEYVGFFDWTARHNISRSEYNTAIPRFVKNKLRNKEYENNARADNLREVRKYANIVYGSKTNISTLIKEILPSKNLSDKDRFSDKSKLSDELGKFNLTYISNLIHLAEKKEEEMAHMAEKHYSRHLLIQRRDIIIPAHYVSQNRYYHESGVNYDSKEAKKRFMEFTNKYLTICGMRELDEKYEFDYYILECFKKNDFVFLSELFDE